MKLFGIAFGIVCAVAGVLFLIAFALLTSFQSQDAVKAAATLAGLPILAFPKIAEFLEREEGRKSLATGRRAPVYDLRAFQIGWPLMVLYGALALWTLGQAAGGLAGLVLSVVLQPYHDGPPPARLLLAMAVIGPTMLTIFAAYFVGRWIGTRCLRRGIVAIVLVAVLTAVGAVAVDVLATTDEYYREMFDAERLSPAHILTRVALVSFNILVPGLIGYWRGRKLRLSKYLHYLLGVLPAETRDTVVDLAFEEAQKVAAGADKARPQPHAAPEGYAVPHTAPA